MNGRPPEIPPHKLISTLRDYNLLPAIVFMPTRRKCDESASEVAGDKSRPHDPAKFENDKRCSTNSASITLRSTVINTQRYWYMPASRRITQDIFLRGSF